MNKIIKKIMRASGYSEMRFEGIESYYSNEDKSFFFTLQFSIDEISGLRKYSEFAEKTIYKDLLERFNKLIKEGQSNTIEKNSSLLVLVKCETLEAIEKYHQQILLLEEDEYFFKKYIILFTENSLAILVAQKNLMDYLNERLNDEVSFSKYAKKGFSDEIADYLMVIQLFIKLPILKVQTGDDNFKVLAEKISDALGERDEQFINWMLENHESISNLDFMLENSEEEIELLLKHLQNDQN